VLQGFFSMSAWPDGDYEVLVVDAESAAENVLRLDLVIVSGASKGEVVSVRAVHLGRGPIEVMGLPATLRVVSGVPRVELD
jgi:hypothetical protein